MLKNYNLNSSVAIWSYLTLSKRSELEIVDFFENEYGIHSDYIVNNMHLTIYHCRRNIYEIENKVQNIYFTIDTLDTRFMVLAPGGENPRPNLIPANKKCGIRIKKNSEFKIYLNNLREPFIELEQKLRFKNRKHSTFNKNAFGARNYQPHISLLKAGSGIMTDLTDIGTNFREQIIELEFDKLVTKKHYS